MPSSFPRRGFRRTPRRRGPSASALIERPQREPGQHAGAIFRHRDRPQDDDIAAEACEALLAYVRPNKPLTKCKLPARGRFNSTDGQSHGFLERPTPSGRRPAFALRKRLENASRAPFMSGSATARSSSRCRVRFATSPTSAPGKLRSFLEGSRRMGCREISFKRTSERFLQ
jgi:hypothetical protein